MGEKFVGDSKSKKKIFIIGAIVIVASLFFLGGYAFQGVEVSTAEASLGTVAETIEGKGVLTSHKTAVVVAKGSFEIEQLNYKVGDRVEKGQILFTTTNNSAGSEVSGVEAKAQGLAAELEQARQFAGKMKALYEEGAISENDYLKARAGEQRLAGEVAALRYSAEGARQSLTFHTMEAPISGIITALRVSEGTVLAPGTPIAEITDMNELYFEVAMNPEDCQGISQGGKVVFKEDNGLSGLRVSKVRPKTEERISDLGTIQKKLIVEVDFNSGTVFTSDSISALDKLTLGRDYKLNFILTEKEGVITVPRNSVFREGDQAYVFKAKGRKAQLTPIETGIKGDQAYEVVSGLKEGDSVILSPGTELKNGTRLKLND